MPLTPLLWWYRRRCRCHDDTAAVAAMMIPPPLSLPWWYRRCRCHDAATARWCRCYDAAAPTAAMMAPPLLSLRGGSNGWREVSLIPSNPDFSNRHGSWEWLLPYPSTSCNDGGVVEVVLALVGVCAERCCCVKIVACMAELAAAS